MTSLNLFSYFSRDKLFRFLFLWILFLFPLKLHASFIESTIGTAVVNDATATYYNPAALTLLANQQLIALGSIAYARNQFIGQTIQNQTGLIQSGHSVTQTHYFLPSMYFGRPITNKVTMGLAILSNFFGTNIDENSILRYAQANNHIQNVDFVTALGIKLNNNFSIGAGINFSYANFNLQPISGFPSLNIADTESHNQADGYALGGEIGFLLKPHPSTTIGFNYRSAMTYSLSGRSIFAADPEVISHHYSFHYWTPARSVISVNYLVKSHLGFIATLQRIQWSIFKEINIHGIAAQFDPHPVILNASVPYHLQDTWLLTLGSQYRITPKWIIRVAGTYNQSPGNGNYQVSHGDSVIVGASMGYQIDKNVMMDASYAHAFIQNQPIHISNGLSKIQGVNKSSLDSLSFKLTFNL